MHLSRWEELHSCRLINYILYKISMRLEFSGNEIEKFLS